MKKTWAVLSDILNRDIRNSVPDNMIINGLECSDKQAIAEHFNSFYATVGELNSRNIMSIMTLVIVTTYQKESNPALNFDWLTPKMSSRL